MSKHSSFMKRMGTLVLTVSGLVLMAGRAQAATTYYATNSGAWTTGATWSPNGTPGDGDSVNITNSYTVTITGAVQQIGAVNNVTLGVNSRGTGTLVVSNSATLTCTNLDVGGTAVNGYLYIDGASVTQQPSTKILAMNGSGGIGQGSVMQLSNKGRFSGPVFRFNGSGARIVVTNGSTFIANNNSSFVVGSSSNLLYVGGMHGDGALAYLDTAGQMLSGAGLDNGIIVDRGGAVSSRMSLGSAATNFYVSITNGGYWALANTSYVGVTNCLGTRVTVSGIDSGGNRSAFNINGKTFVIGQQANAYGNGLVINNGGVVSNATSGIQIGQDAASSNNYISVYDGGLFYPQGAITVGVAGNAGNVVSNGPGGILQFNTVTPALTVNNPNLTLSQGNAFIITNGTVSFRGTFAVGLTNNWAGSLAPSNNITWQGANTLRLDGTKGTARDAYTFYNNNGPTNYAGLELFNSASLVSNQAVTIGSSVPSQGGSLLVTNGSFSIRGVVTNYSPNVNLADVTSLAVSNGIVWMAGSAATTTAGTVTFDAITTNQLDSGTVAWNQSAATATQVVNGLITGAGGLQKSGPGVLVLAGNNKYAGATTVSGGTLQLNGVVTGNVSVASGATLNLAGSVTGAVSVASGGSLVGTGPVVGAVTNDGAYHVVVTNATPETINISGSLVLQAGAQLVLSAESIAYLGTSSSTFTIIHASGGLSGTFASDNLPQGWRLSYDAVGGYVKLQPGYPGTMIMFQ